MSPTFKTAKHCVLAGCLFSHLESGSSEELLPESSHATWIIEFGPIKLKEGARTRMQHWPSTIDRGLKHSTFCHLHVVIFSWNFNIMSKSLKTRLNLPLSLEFIVYVERLAWHKPIHFSWGEAKQPISARRERVDPWLGLFFDAFDTLERCFGTFKTARSRYLKALRWF